MFFFIAFFKMHEKMMIIDHFYFHLCLQGFKLAKQQMETETYRSFPPMFNANFKKSKQFD